MRGLAAHSVPPYRWLPPTFLFHHGISLTIRFMRAVAATPHLASRRAIAVVRDSDIMGTGAALRCVALLFAARLRGARLEAQRRKGVRNGARRDSHAAWRCRGVWNGGGRPLVAHAAFTHATTNRAASVPSRSSATSSPAFRHRALCRARRPSICSISAPLHLLRRRGTVRAASTGACTPLHTRGLKGMAACCGRRNYSRHSNGAKIR